MRKPERPDGEGDQEQLARDLVKTGGEVAGAAVGGALGLIGGPVGVAAGAAGGVLATRVFRRIGAELEGRWLSPREHARVGGAFAIAASDIKSRLDAGESLREDGFLDGNDDERSEAEEVLEGMLKAAADAYEERKLPYIANIYSSIAFRPDISAAYANTLVQLASRCTWRQFVLISLIGEDDSNFAEKLGRILEPTVSPPAEPLAAIWIDLDTLAFSGLVGVRQDDRSVAHVAAVLGGGSFRQLGWSRAALTAVGRDLFQLSQLIDVPKAELEAAIAALKRD